ncbi:hypothetical protein [Symbiopectobacterium purcellii]|uniref:Uncharacterized protein n=1 Tax=Symbiopectobacterium purcellii TaxID=2871826 RepID=A0ABX9AID3_9ENTR|nr:hypothetical protein [Symbiopectobacterium purcellii]QZN94548.1 hypothetical protein K6K13_14745 [Symbiopectobacterium purcellii]
MLSEDAALINEDEFKSKHVVKSSKIYGATSIDGVDYIVFDNNLIKIISNNDDTFLLGDKNTVSVYKNSRSNIYYYMSGGNNDNYRAETFKERSSHCITKRQLFSLCSARFYESKDITTLLRRNSEHSIDFDNLSEHLEPYEDTNGFYKDKHSPERIYYLSQDGGAFHVMEEKNNDDMIPVFFKIYGKNEDNSINNNVLVTDVSIVKDFDTKQAIVTTPLEAMNMVFNLNAEKNKALLKWSESQVSRRPINADYKDLEDIQKKVNKNTDYITVELFFFS